MIRYTLLWLYITFAIGASFRNWFIALCMTFPILAVIERPDMPREMFGISGLNPYNVVLLFILMNWFFQRKKEHLSWNMPSNLNRLFLVYLILITVSFLRMASDLQSFHVYPMPNNQTISFQSFLKSDYLNSLKYLIPGLLLLHGINSRERVRYAVWAVLSFGFLLSFQVTTKMLPALIGSDDLATRALRVLDRDIGYHRVNLAAMTAGFSWAFFSLISTAKANWERYFAYSGFALSSLAMALSGGRAGMMAWLGCGFLLALLRYRKLFIIGPLIGVIALAGIPGLYDRLIEGFTDDTHEHSVEGSAAEILDSEGHDLYAVTSGRVVAWPLVIEHIKEKPLLGHGKRAMVRLGIMHELADLLGTKKLNFGHPHNAYLELLLDHGLLGAIPILLFFVIIGFKAIPFISNTVDKDVTLGAGFLLAFLVTQAIAALGSQSFYPDNGMVPLWSAIGVFFAVLKLGSKEDENVVLAKECEAPVRKNYYR